MVNHTILIVSRKWTSYHKALNIKTWHNIVGNPGPCLGLTQKYGGVTQWMEPQLSLPLLIQAYVELCLIQLYVMKFVCDLWQVWCDEVCLWLVTGLMWWSLSVTCGRSDVMKFVCDLWHVRCFFWFQHHQYNWPTQHYTNGNILHKNSEETDS